MNLDQLNLAQKNAVTTTDGPLMILAGAGSGKTKTLVSKIAYLIEECKVGPYRILALTFSNKAAREMRERVASELSIQAGALQITTFHSFCARVLRSEANYLGLSRNFTIYDSGESRSVVKKLLAKKGLSPKDQSPYEVMYYIDDIKNHGLYPGKDVIDGYKIDRDDPFYAYYQAYEDELHQSNAVDFGGLIVGALQLFEQFPEVLERYQQRFEYILVDEYQDTNRSQFQLLKLLSELKKNICVVGDEDQSIYSWRGADIRNILDFEQVFSHAKLIKLEQNYRSSKTIIDAASHIIAKNQARKGKTMWTNNAEGDAIEIIECADDTREGEFVAKEISSIANAGEEWRNIAVFYRNNAQSRIIEDHLIRKGIPYRIVAGIKFYERKEIKDMLAYMRLMANPKDSLALSRIINTPTRGIGATTLRKLEQLATQGQMSLWEVISNIADYPENYQGLRLSARMHSSLKQFCHLMSECILMESAQEAPSQIYHKLLHESGLHQYLCSRKDYESVSRMENLDELYNAIKQFEQIQENPSILSYLESITLDEAQSHLADTGGQVSLMTIHGSKGLEFNHVFVTGAEENIFPSIRALAENELALEEERRLFYVAMTRAMKKLSLSFAQGRMLFGQLKFNGPSRFLDEIPAQYYSWKTYLTRKSTLRKKSLKNIDYDPQYSQLPDTEAQRLSPAKPGKKTKFSPTFAPGLSVLHALYGEGYVINSQGNGANEYVVIKFAHGARKKFLVKFAPITPL